jgi:hypothetical protein
MLTGPLLCRFLDAGMTNPSTPYGGRRPKSAKARSRGKFGTDVAAALWGFDSGAGLEGGCNTDRMRPADQPLARLEAYNRHIRAFPGKADSGIPIAARI